MLLYVVLCACVVSGQSVVDGLEDAVDTDFDLILNLNIPNSLKIHCDTSIFVSINSSITFDGISWTSTLNCSFSSLSPLQLSWHYKGKRLEGVILTLSNVTTNTLTIGNVSESDNGEYICLAVSCRSISDVSLWPHWPPGVSVNVSSEKTLDVGTVVRATCTAYPNATLNWLWDHESNDFSNGSQIQGEYYSDVNGNSVSTLTFTINDTNNVNELKCCVHPSDVTFPVCNSLTLQVPIEAELTWYRLHSANDSSLSLSCGFGGVPLPNLTSWSYCSSENSSDCTFLTNGTKSVVDGFLETNYTTDALRNYTYIRCSTFVPNGQLSHVFNITQTQIVPELMSSNFSVNHVTANGGFDVTFRCQFEAQPTPRIAWLKKRSDDPVTNLIGFNGSQVRPDGVRINMSISSSEGDVHETTLTIGSYSVDDYGFYTCVSYNSIGLAHSPPMFPIDNAHSKLVVVSSRSNNTFEVGDEVQVTCFIQGEAIPQPTLRVSVVSESSLNYTTSRGQHHVNVTFTADATNDIVIINCEAVAHFASYHSQRKEEIAILTNHESILIGFKSCLPDDFANGSSCDLVCSVCHGPLSQPKRHQWIYFSFLGNNSFYMLGENQSVQDVSPMWTNYSISLSTYYAGHYQCLISYYNPILLPDTVTHVFKIDPDEDGSQLNDECFNQTQCLAYNAVCDRGLNASNVCQCQRPYDFPMALNLSTSACVGAAYPGESCYNNLQCEAAQLNYNCSDFHCQCAGFLVKIHELNGTERCRTAVEQGDPCVYDEDCQLYDPNSFCNNFMCSCVNHYIYKEFLDTCGNERVLSGGAIAGVVISTIAALILVVFFISFGRGRWRARRNRVLSSQHLALDSNDLEDEEMDFPQFNSFTHFPVIEDET